MRWVAIVVLGLWVALSSCGLSSQIKLEFELEIPETIEWAGAPVEPEILPFILLTFNF